MPTVHTLKVDSTVKNALLRPGIPLKPVEPTQFSQPVADASPIVGCFDISEE